MDAIKAARELGKAIQAEQCFKDYEAAKKANDEDEELQRLIGEFNLTRQNLQLEMNKPEKDDVKIAEINSKLQTQYADVMKNVNMANFVVVKGAVDEMLEKINMIIGMCCEGEDPDTCEPTHHCGGNCGSCGGCH